MPNVLVDWQKNCKFAENISLRGSVSCKTVASAGVNSLSDPAFAKGKTEKNLSIIHRPKVMKVAIVKYDAGNIFSVVSALRRLGVEPVLTDEAEELIHADRVIFPGQGHAATTMTKLRALGLDKLIPHLQQPVLGICVGQQLLCQHSEEGSVSCLDVFHTSVQRFRPSSSADKVPCMGWNSLHQLTSPLFEGIEEGNFAYFVHSYFVPVCAETIATAHHVQPYSAALHRNNFWATQFHPEKSGEVGERLLRNFLGTAVELASKPALR